jgi:cold-inducible RNA-binding protein
MCVLQTFVDLVSILHYTVKIYVGNLSFYTSKETLKEIFEEFGEVYDCYLPLDPETERPRGFGFITMEREAGETAIAELDGMELDDRVVRINEAVGKSRTKSDMAEESDFGF